MPQDLDFNKIIQEADLDTTGVVKIKALPSPEEGLDFSKLTAIKPLKLGIVKGGKSIYKQPGLKIKTVTMPERPIKLTGRSEILKEEDTPWFHDDIVKDVIDARWELRKGFGRFATSTPEFMGGIIRNVGEIAEYEPEWASAKEHIGYRKKLNNWWANKILKEIKPEVFFSKGYWKEAFSKENWTIKKVMERVFDPLTPEELKDEKPEGWLVSARKALVSPIAKRTDLDEKIANLGIELTKKTREFNQKLWGTPDTKFAALMQDIGSGLGSFALAYGLTRVTGSPKAAMIAFGAIAKGYSYNEARAAGLSPEKANSVSNKVGLGEMALEGMGLHFLFKRYIKPLQGAIIRIVSEGMQETSQSLNESFWMQQAGAREEDIVEILKDAAYEGLIGMLVSAPGAINETRIDYELKQAGILDKKLREKLIENVIIQAKKEALGFVESEKILQEATAEEIEGWSTPIIWGKEDLVEIQQAGLPRGKLVTLDKPFESSAHDKSKTKKVTINRKDVKVYNPDGVSGFKKTPNIHAEMVEYVLKNMHGELGFRDLITKFLKSKGYNAYITGIYGDVSNRELIIFADKLFELGDKVGSVDEEELNLQYNKMLDEYYQAKVDLAKIDPLNEDLNRFNKKDIPEFQEIIKERIKAINEGKALGEQSFRDYFKQKLLDMNRGKLDEYGEEIHKSILDEVHKIRGTNEGRIKMLESLALMEKEILTERAKNATKYLDFWDKTLRELPREYRERVRQEGIGVIENFIGEDITVIAEHLDKVYENAKNQLKKQEILKTTIGEANKRIADEQEKYGIKLIKIEQFMDEKIPYYEITKEGHSQKGEILTPPEIRKAGLKIPDGWTDYYSTEEVNTQQNEIQTIIDKIDKKIEQKKKEFKPVTVEKIEEFPVTELDKPTTKKIKIDHPTRKILEEFEGLFEFRQRGAKGGYVSQISSMSGLSKEATKAVIKNIKKGKSLTPKQQGVWEQMQLAWEEADKQFGVGIVKQIENMTSLDELDDFYEMLIDKYEGEEAAFQLSHEWALGEEAFNKKFIELEQKAIKEYEEALKDEEFSEIDKATEVEVKKVENILNIQRVKPGEAEPGVRGVERLAEKIKRYDGLAETMFGMPYKALNTAQKESVKKRFKTGGTTVEVESFDDLPIDLQLEANLRRARAKSQGKKVDITDRIGGFYDQKSDVIYVIRYGMNKEVALEHEKIHRDTMQMPEKQRDRLLDAIYKEFKDHPSLQEIIEVYGFNVDTEAGRRGAAEEIRAYTKQGDAPIAQLDRLNKIEREQIKPPIAKAEKGILEKQVGDVIFVGKQKGAEGEFVTNLYNLNVDIPGHPKGSTVSEETVKKAGLTIPQKKAITPEAKHEQIVSPGLKGKAKIPTKKIKITPKERVPITELESEINKNRKLIREIKRSLKSGLEVLDAVKKIKTAESVIKKLTAEIEIRETQKEMFESRKRFVKDVKTSDKKIKINTKEIIETESKINQGEKDKSFKLRKLATKKNKLREQKQKTINKRFSEWLKYQDSEQLAKEITKKSPKELSDFVFDETDNVPNMSTKDLIEHVMKINPEVKYISKAVERMGMAAGLYYRKQDLVKMRLMTDIRTMVHETAHWWQENTFGKIEDTKELVKNDPKAFQELKRLDYNPQLARFPEGFAEFVAMWSMGIDMTEKAPIFKEIWEKQILPEYDKKGRFYATKAIIRLFQAQNPDQFVESWLQFHKDRSRYAAMKRFLNDLIDKNVFVISPLIAKFKEKAYSRTGVIEFILKKEMGKKRFESLLMKENLIDMYKNYQMKAGAVAETMITRGVHDIRTGKTVSRGLIQVLHDVHKEGYDTVDFIKYIYCKHALTWWKNNKNPGISEDIATIIVKKYKSEIFDKHGAEITNFWDKLLKMIAREGGITTNEYDLMRKTYPYYVPLIRDLIEEGVFSTSGYRMGGIANLSDPIKRATGSDLPIKFYMDAWIKQTEKLVLWAQRSHLANILTNYADMDYTHKFVRETDAPVEVKKISIDSLIDALEERGYRVEDLNKEDIYKGKGDQLINFYFNKVYYVGKHPIIEVWKKGKRHWYEIDRRVFRSLIRDLTARPQLGVFNLIAPFARMIRLGATGAKPSFIFITNFIKDAFTSAVLGQTGDRTPFDGFGALIAQILDREDVKSDGVLGKLCKMTGQDPKYADLYRKSGGVVSTMAGIDQYTLKKTADLLISKMEGHDIRFGMKHPIQGLRFLFATIENTNRIPEFQAIYDMVYKQTSDKVEAFVRASRGGQDVTTDFANSGTWGQQLNQIIPFYNPSMQGFNKFLRAYGAEKEITEYVQLYTEDHVKGQPERTGKDLFGEKTKKLKSVRSRKNVGKRFAKGVGWLSALSMLSYFLRDKEAWEKLPAFDRYAYWNFWIGDSHIQIASPFYVGALFHGGSQYLLQKFEEDPEADKEYLKYIFDNQLADLLPIKLSRNPLGNVALFGTLEELGTNIGWYGKPIEPRYGRETKKAKEIIYPWTSKVSVFAANKILAPLGFDGISPVQVEYFANQTTGGAYRGALSLVDWVTGTKLRENQKGWIGKIPLIEVLGDRPSPMKNKYVDRFYNEYAEAKKDKDYPYGDMIKSTYSEIRKIRRFYDDRDKANIEVAKVIEEDMKKLYALRKGTKIKKITQKTKGVKIKKVRRSK